MIRTRSTRVVQPVGNAAVADRWAQKSPVLLASAATCFANAVTGALPAFGSTSRFLPSSIGVGADGSAPSTTSTIGFEGYDFGGTTPITVIAFSDEMAGASRTYLAQGTEVILRATAAGTGVEFILNSFATNDRTSVLADARSSPGFFAGGTYGPSGKLRAYANTAVSEITPTGTYAKSAELFTAIYTQGLNQLFDKRLALLGVFRSEFSQAEMRELSANPWQLFNPIERRIWVPVSTGGGGAVVGNASAALASLSLSPSSATASGSAVASAFLANIGLTPATATASGGAAIPATASADLAPVSLSAAQATASGAAVATAELAGIILAPAGASASGGAAVPATATASLASISTTPAQASASGAATAAGPMVGMNLTPSQAQAAGAAWASAQLVAISITPASATARGPIEAPDETPILSVANSTTYLSVAGPDTYLSVADGTTHKSIGSLM